MATIKEIQEQLGVKTDGIWGRVSHETLILFWKEHKEVHISENFLVSELLDSNDAVRLGIDNTPTPSDFLHLVESTNNLWQPVRTNLGTPVSISSAFRCKLLNDAVGSKDTSAHLKGYAIDFKSPKFGTPRQVVNEISKMPLKFDQCIYEFGRWVHLGYKNQKGEQRRQVFDIV